MADIKDIWIYANNILHSSRQMVNEGLAGLQLSSAEGNILMHLYTRDHSIRQEDIVAQLELSKPAVSRALESLERKGYVARSRDASDRRASLVALTDRALSIRPAVEQVYNQVYAVALEGVSEQEAAFFIALFARVSECFTKAKMTAKNQRRQDSC
jgi:DNA-binding MarR family transcriptional regulator